MSTNNETSKIFFPWDGDLPTHNTIVIRDIDVIGVGSKRRRQLEDLQKTKSIIMETHESIIPESVRVIYEEELFRTFQWLRPLKVERAESFDLQVEQRRLFGRIFPMTQKQLGFTAQKVCDTYLQEMDWSSWLLQDHWRYFVGYLRQRFPQHKQLVDLAYWEWVTAWLEMQPFDVRPPNEEGIVGTNPSLQIVPVLENNEILQRDKGMYAFVDCSSQNTVLETRLSPEEALLIDLLQEDRKYTEAQLIEQAMLSEEISQQLTQDQWMATLANLKDHSILLIKI